jgi:SAM-dependent methyltransferase
VVPMGTGKTAVLRSLKKRRRRVRRAFRQFSWRRLLIRMTTRPSTRHGLVGPPDLWAMKRRFQFEFLTSRGLLSEHRMLDVGCGTLRGGIPFIDYLETGHYSGVEARAEVLEEGRKELAEAGLEHKRPVLIHESDPTRVELATPVDFAWAFSVLIHMHDETVDAVLGLVSDCLSEGGKFYANVATGENWEGGWEGFPIVRRPLEFYEGLASRHGLAASSVGTLYELGHRTGSRVQDDGVMLCFARSSSASVRSDAASVSSDTAS